MGNPVTGEHFLKPGTCDVYYKCENGKVLRICPIRAGSFKHFAFLYILVKNLEHVGHTIKCNLSSRQHFVFLKGILHEWKCSQGLIFNSETKTCDWEQNAPECTPGPTQYPSIYETPKATEKPEGIYIAYLHRLL